MKKGVCPICGGDNNCASIKNLDHSTCWCNDVKFQKEVLEYIPEKLRGISCVCPSCNHKYKNEKKIIKPYDLHIHTIASDGTLTPSEIVENAKMKNLLGLAITDHDTVDGLKEAMDKGKEMGIEVIPGIELSTNLYGKDVHILGYFLDLEDEKFISEIEGLKKIREERNLKILEKLKSRRIILSEADIKKEALGNIVSKLHIANALINKGHAYSKAEAFRNYLGEHGVAYVPKENFTPQMAVKILKANGAKISLAHPLIITKSIKELEKLVLELKELGLGGLETEYPTFTNDEKNQLRNLAKKHDLFSSGGSDFHGKNREGIDIGFDGLTYSQFDFIKNGGK
ncbi:MAG: cysteine-rich CWC family protein [Fusobacteriaceae bacterium]